MASADSQALTRTYRTSAPALNKTTRQMVSPFVQKLYELVNAPTTDELIRWSDTGDSFFVFEHERFANDVLPRYFKHRNFSSFVRQLNMYGFHKIPHLQQGVLKSDTETEFWNFENPNFHRGQPDLLCLVIRKNSKGGSQQGTETLDGDIPTSGQSGAQILDVNSIVNGITAIKRHQQTISADLSELKASNQHLWQEALVTREKYKSQQDTINRILKFLASVFGRADNHDGKDVDGHSPPPPLVRRNQRLLIDNGPESSKHKGVEVVEVEDDDNKNILETVLNEDNATTPLPFARIETPSVKSPSAAPASPLFSPAAPSTGAYLADRGSGVLASPAAWMTAPPASNSSAPVPVPTPAGSTAALELHRLQSAHASSGPPNQDQLMQAAFQQLLQSPGQVQRLMQMLSSGPTNAPALSPAPASLPAPSAQPSVSWTPPTPADFNQLSQLALYDGGSNNALTFDKDIGPSAAQLAEDEARLARTYQSAGEIDSDVEALQANINALIENMGLDPTVLATHSPAASTVPAPEFDFDAFLTAFANENDPAGGTALNSEAKMGDAPVAGRKRTSDVADLTLHLAPSSPPSAVAAQAVAEAPRTKRNKM